MICPSCTTDVHPMKELNPGGGFTDTCPSCSAAMPKASTVLANQGAPMQQGLDAASAPPRVHGKTRSGALAFGTSGTPLDPVDAIRARLSAVQAQIPTPAQLKALRAEERGLLRALKALGADASPKPN